MVSLTATSSATPSLSVSLAKSRLEQARREAAQAEANAQNLRAQANDQEHVAEQGHQRANALAKYTQSASSPASSASKPEAPATSQVQIQSDPTYSEKLANTFEAVKPLLSADYLSPTAKNIVTSSLIQATTELWSSSQTPARAVQLYDGQANKATSPVGSVINASA